jgi:LmbE family N-acetylglucosaminyl deacetylase
MMIGVKLNKNNNQSIKIICFGAHCDDIEIGCGGTLLSMLQKFKNVEVYWVVFSSDPKRGEEARASANMFLKHAKGKTIEIKKFRNGFFPFDGGEIKEYFEMLKDKFSPDLIFTHYRMDLHQDHRTVSELTWNTFRNHLILEFEIPKYDGDIGTPNFFVPLHPSICKNKVITILKTFKTQVNKHWLTEDLLYSTLRIRGMECVSKTNFAEAFYCKKLLYPL